MVEVFFELVDDNATRVVVRDGVGVEGKADEVGRGVGKVELIRGDDVCAFDSEGSAIDVFLRVGEVLLDDTARYFLMPFEEGVAVVDGGMEGGRGGEVYNADVGNEVVLREMDIEPLDVRGLGV